MVFWGLIGGILLTSIIWGVVDGSKVPEDTPHRAKKQFKEFYESFFCILLIGIVSGGLLYGLIGVITFSLSDGTQELVVNETYKLAPDSMFSQEEQEISFTFVNEDGRLESKSVDYDKLHITDTSNETVTVRVFDEYHRWLTPWSINSKTVVRVD